MGTKAHMIPRSGTNRLEYYYIVQLYAQIIQIVKRDQFYSHRQIRRSLAQSQQDRKQTQRLKHIRKDMAKLIIVSVCGVSSSRLVLDQDPANFYEIAVKLLWLARFVTLIHKNHFANYTLDSKSSNPLPKLFAKLLSASLRLHFSPSPLRLH